MLFSRYTGVIRRMLALCAALVLVASCGEQDLAVLTCGVAPFDDAHEPDNNRTLAMQQFPLADGAPFDGTADSYFHRDVYEIESSGGDITASLIFEHALGDLDLFLFDETGNVLLAESESTDDNESLTLSPAGAGTYYLLVRLYGCPMTAPFPLFYEVEFVEGP